MERGTVQVMVKRGKSRRQIARELRRSCNTATVGAVDGLVIRRFAQRTE